MTEHAEPMLVDKQRMAALLGWSRPMLDRRIEADSSFPIIKRGRGHRDPWQFDARAVIAYVQNGAVLDGPQPALFEPDTRLAGELVDDELEQQLQEAARLSTPKARETKAPLPRAAGKVVHIGEATAAQRLKEVQAEAALDKLKVARAQLVEAAAVEHQVVGFCVHLGRALDALGERIAREAGLDAGQAEEVRTLIDDARRAAVTEYLATLVPADATT